MREFPSTGAGGLVASLVTPFTADGSLDLWAFERQTQAILDAGVSAVCVAGATGEYPSLTVDEYTTMIRSISESSSDATIVAGAFEATPAGTVARLHVAADHGADLGMIIAPPFVNLDEWQLVAYYRAVLAETPLPVLLFETASRTRSSLSIASLFALSAEFESLLGVKDSLGDMLRLTALVNNPAGLVVLQGRDELLFPSLCLGAHGSLNSFTALAPQTCAALARAVAIGDLVTAREIHAKLLDWAATVYRWVSPVGIKAIMSMLGSADSAVRSPLTAVPDADRKSLTETAEDIRTTEARLATESHRPSSKQHRKR